MGQKINLINKQFNKLKIIGESSKRASNGAVYWFAKCECGNCIEVIGSSLISENTKSCGKCPVNKYESSNEHMIGYTSKNEIFLFDKKDYSEIKKYTWCIDDGYVSTTTSGSKLRMHDLVMKPSKGMIVDHIYHKRYDNRRSELRVCTRQENQWNRSGKNKNNTSGYNGVCKCPKSNKWISRIMLNRKEIHIGRFETPEKASEAYAEKAKELYGDYFTI